MASTTTVTLFTFSLLLSLSTVTSHLSSTILDAAEILTTAGHEAMALNLELASQSLLARRQSRSLTVFAPTNFAFSQIPQLPLSLLRYHLLPHAFSLHSLRSLPFGANIATLLPGHSLTVTTTSNRRLSINNVTVNPTPLLDDGYLVIFQTGSFFDPYFQLPRPSSGGCFSPRKISDAGARFFGSKRLITDSSTFPFKEASGVLRSRGCSVTAAFLDLQFLGLKERPDQITVFAPIDEAMSSHVGNVTEYSDILRHHLVPCKIVWNDLVALEEGTLISTYQRDFTLNVKTSAGSDLFLLNNGVPVVFPDLYISDWLVVHGIGDILLDTVGAEEVSVQADESSSFDEFDHHRHHQHHDHHHNRAHNPAEHSHFSVFH